MNSSWTTIGRWASGPALLVLLSLVLLGCNVHVGYQMSYSGPLDGRTPASFEVACAETGSVLLEAEDNVDNHAESKCVAAHGGWFACDWAAQRCTAECRSTEAECVSMRSMGYVPLMRQKEMPAASNPDRASPDSFGGL